MRIAFASLWRTSHFGSSDCHQFERENQKNKNSRKLSAARSSFPKTITVHHTRKISHSLGWMCFGCAYYLPGFASKSSTIVLQWWANVQRAVWHTVLFRWFIGIGRNQANEIDSVRKVFWWMRRGIVQRSRALRLSHACRRTNHFRILRSVSRIMGFQLMATEIFVWEWIGQPVTEQQRGNTLHLTI